MEVHDASEADVDELCALLNEIVRRGGTTAIEEPFSRSEFRRWFLEGDNHLLCLVARDEAGRAAGFQALVRHAKRPAGWADIATFTRRSPPLPGTGTRLFAATRARAPALGVAHINATIRADNVGGLAYYAKMGFVDHAIERGVPLADGTPVDRISKRCDLGAADWAADGVVDGVVDGTADGTADGTVDGTADGAADGAPGR